MKKIYSFISRVEDVTGVQKVVLDIHNAVKDSYESKVVGLCPFHNVNPNLEVREDEYVRLRNPFMFRSSVVFVHERKYLLFFWLLNHILYQQIKIVYVHHNMLYGHRYTTVLPNNIVAISDKGIQNLTEYFRAPISHIHKIHNCVEDRKELKRSFLKSDDIIKILYPGRINRTKRQIEIVEHLRGRLDRRIVIDFAGVGPMYEDFKAIIEDQFHSIGFVNDIPKTMLEYDYVMLFSKHEGLPLTLIEANMTGTPIICNDVGGNVEIAHDGENAFVVNDWENLVTVINDLVFVSKEKYYEMSKNGRSYYEKDFTFDLFKRKYLDMIKIMG